MGRRRKIKPSDSFRNSSEFQWNLQRSQAAILLASGHTQEEVSIQVKITPRQIYNWLQVPDFSAEVDRLSLMVGASSRAERLRIAMRVIRAKVKEGIPETDKDLLEWLKFAQSETDGVKLDLTKLSTALGADEAPLADSGPVRASSTPESDSIN